MNFPTGFSTFCASTIFMIESSNNGDFWKFRQFYFKHYSKCQFFAAKKRKKTDAKKTINF